MSSEIISQLNLAEAEQFEEILPSISQTLQEALNSFPNVTISEKDIAHFAYVVEVIINHVQDQAAFIEMIDAVAKQQQADLQTDTPEELRLLPEIYKQMFTQIKAQEKNDPAELLKNQRAMVFCAYTAYQHRANLQIPSLSQDNVIASQIPMAIANVMLRRAFNAKVA